MRARYYRMSQYDDEIARTVKVKKVRNERYVYWYPMKNKRGSCLGTLDQVITSLKLLLAFYDLKNSYSLESMFLAVLEAYKAENYIEYIQHHLRFTDDFLGYFESVIFYLEKKRET